MSKKVGENVGVLSATHDYDCLTGFCKNCGLHRAYVMDNEVQCVYGSNVVAISHLRAAAKFREKVQRAKESLAKAEENRPDVDAEIERYLKLRAEHKEDRSETEE